MPDPVELLLLALDAAPPAALAALDRALHVEADKPRLLAALKTDARFAPLIRRLIADSEVAASRPWVTQFLGAQRYAPAVPELVALWRLRRGSLSDQSGQALLKIGDPVGIAALAEDLGQVVGLAQRIAVEAVFALRADEAFERIAPLVEARGQGASGLLFAAARRPELREDPRWVALAASVAGADRAGLRDAARTFLEPLAPSQKRELLPDAPMAFVPGPGPPGRGEAFARAARAVDKLRDTLPEPCRTPPADETELAALEALVGALPAWVRAFYERIGSVRIDGPKRFQVHPITVALEEARQWTERYRPAETPAPLVPPFLFPVAPDATTLGGRSGGPDVAFELPCAVDDPKLLHTRGTPRFSTFVKRAARALAP